jgi:hypothetical protein
MNADYQTFERSVRWWTSNDEVHIEDVIDLRASDGECSSMRVKNWGLTMEAKVIDIVGNDTLVPVNVG